MDLAEIQAAYYMVAATGVLVAAFYYVMNMRATQRNLKANLETRQAQLLMAVYDKLQDPRTVELYLDMVNTGFKDYQEFKNKFSPNDPQKFKPVGEMAMLLEGFGVLVREKLVDIRIVTLLSAGVIRKYFEKLKPFLVDIRKETGYSRFMDQTEYLYDQLMEYMEKHPDLKT